MAKYRAFIIASGALFALALARAAGAADLLPPPPVLEPQPPAPMEFNGWYLRGDAGAAYNSSSIGLTTTPDPLATGTFAAGANESYNNTTLSSSELFDVGVGYQFNSWFRSDVTLEYRDGGAFQSLYVLNNPGAATGDVSQYANFYRGNVASWIAMVNGYVDLGTWSGITPYVGAGVGYARNTLYGLTDTGENTTVGGISSSAAGGYFANGSTNNFAWALMTGLDFNVTQNLKLELGYRYLNLGTYASGASSCLNGTGAGGGFSTGSCGGSNYYLKTDRLASNDFRIGLIWMLGEETPPPPPAPLVRKY
jgi:opacity protein-like surface antigen